MLHQIPGEVVDEKSCLVMSIVGKKPIEYLRFTRAGMILIILMGLARFFVGISGVPFERATHLLSLTELTLVLFVIYGHKTAAEGFGTYRHLLPVSAALSISMYGFIVLAILAESLGGLEGYFHYHSLHTLGGQLPPQLMGLIDVNVLMNAPTHIIGQIFAGVFVTFIGWGLASIGFLYSRYLGFLRNAFLWLVGFGIFRLVLGAAGVPHAIGTWISSLTLVTVVLAIYSGYSAPSKGFDRFWQMILVALPLSIVLNVMVIGGMIVASSLGLANYFNPEGIPIGQHISGHVALSIIGTIPLAILTSIGFALGRKSPALKSQRAQ